jgi:hypothetical protein
MWIPVLICELFDADPLTDIRTNKLIIVHFKLIHFYHLEIFGSSISKLLGISKFL